MKNFGPERKLEAFKIFPYVAWLLIAVFALFVYKISTELTATASELEEASSKLETTTNTWNNDINIDFEQ